jgi:hypothetical protein
VRVIAALLIFLSAEAHAEDYLLGAAIGLLVIDWGQTRAIATEPDRFRERNPILGEHPSRGEVDRYFALSVAATAGLSYVLPDPYRTWFLTGVVVLEASAVINNHQLGVKVSF